MYNELEALNKKYPSSYIQPYLDEWPGGKNEVKNPRYLERTRWYIFNKRRRDINFCIRSRLRTRLAIAFKYMGIPRPRKREEYGIDYDAIIKHLGPRPADGGEYEIDHIRPLSSFDLTNPQEIRTAFAPENHQWLSAKENQSKGCRF